MPIAATAAATAAAPTTLPALCEPLFLEICRLNRIGRTAPAAAGDLATAKAGVKAIFDEMAARAKADAPLLANYEKVELPLLFFADSMLSESKLPYAPAWNAARLAYERNELAGDEKFFDLLEETLNDPKKDAASDERLVIFYTCLGLGFAGWYAGDNAFLSRKMREIQPRIRKWLDTDEQGLISPETYKHTNTANLPLPLASLLVPLLVLGAVLAVIAAAANIVLFKTASSDLIKAVETIRAHESQRIKHHEKGTPKPTDDADGAAGVPASTPPPPATPPR